MNSQTHYELIFARDIEVEVYGTKVLYPEGKSYMTGLTKNNLKSLEISGTCSEVHGHGVTTYFDFPKDFNILELTTITQTRKVNFKDL